MKGIKLWRSTKLNYVLYYAFVKKPQRFRIKISAYSVFIASSREVSWMRVPYGSLPCGVLEKEFTSETTKER